MVECSISLQLQIHYVWFLSKYLLNVSMYQTLFQALRRH